MPQPDEPMTSDESVSPLIAPAVVREMSGGCGWSVAEFAEYFDPRARAELAELEDACRRGDLRAVARLAHGAAGSAASAGMTGMVAAYHAVEACARTGDEETIGRRMADARERLEAVLAALRHLGVQDE